MLGLTMQPVTACKKEVPDIWQTSDNLNPFETPGSVPRVYDQSV